MSTRNVLGALILVVAVVSSSAAQPLGTFRWQLQPYCNVITVSVTQTGSTYTLDGTDDLCGASPRAAATGMAFVNPTGSIGFGLTLVVPPGPTPVHVNATIDISTLSGTWQDSAGNSGTFVYNPASAPGSPRPPARQVFSGGLSLGGSAITNVGTPVAPADAANKGYVDAALAASVASAMSGGILVTAAPSAWRSFTSNDNVTFQYFSNVTYVTRATTGSTFLSVQPTIPTALYGRSLRLRGVQFCYTASASATLSYLEVNATTATVDAGSRSGLLSDVTNRTDAACRYYVLPTPFTFTAANGVNVFVQVTWSANSEFRIGRTTFVLEPTTTPVVVPSLAPDAITVLSPGRPETSPLTAPPSPWRQQ